MNKKGDIPITILVIGIILVCGIALFSFFSSSVKVRNNFVGIGLVEQLNSQIEENTFYGKQTGTALSSADINTAIDYAQKNEIVNRICKCGDKCGDYANWISQYSSENGIPEPILVLSVMMQESECVSSSFSGSSVGLMQVSLKNCGHYNLPPDEKTCYNQLINPQTNIEVGTKILREKYDSYKGGKIFNGCSNRGITYTEWDAALRGYNGWGCGVDANGVPFTEQDNYVDEVNQRYDALKKAGNYIESDKTSGILWWAKQTLSFSVEYQGKP